MTLLQGVFFLLLLCWMNASQLWPQEEIFNAFGCLGNVIRNYQEFPLFSECSTEIDRIGEYCSNDEITCHATKEKCRAWGVNKINVSIFIQFPTSKFIHTSKSLTYECECREYIFECTIHSQVLIQSIVHKDAIFTSTLTSTTLKTTRAVTTMAHITKKPSTTDSSKTINPGMLGDHSNQNSETPYLAITGALIGGAVLGAGVEYLLIILLKRNRLSKNKKIKENITGMSKYNPAYSGSGESTKNPMKPDDKYYTQIVNTNNIYQNVTQGTADVHQERSRIHEAPTHSIYNHLHEKKETGYISDHYDHARCVAFELTATEKDYDTLKMPPQANTYREVVSDEIEHTCIKYKNGEENDDYFVLENRKIGV